MKVKKEEPAKETSKVGKRASNHHVYLGGLTGVMWLKKMTKKGSTGFDSMEGC